MNDETTAALLAEAMHAEVDAAVPPATLISDLPVRAARRRHARITVVGVAASITLVTAALSFAGGSRPAPPTGLPSATPSATGSPEPPIVQPPRMEATSLPPGFAYWNTEHATTNPAGSGEWPRVVTYARGFTDAGRPRTPIAVTTSVDAVVEVDIDDFDDPGARWVPIGTRRVVRAEDPPGTIGYHWTEKSGVNVSVTAGPGVTDAELRQVVAGARLVTPEPPTSTLVPLEPFDGTGVLLAETRGTGSRILGPIAVPAEFDVHIACDGTDVRVQIGDLRDGTWGCDPDSPLRQIVDRTNGVRSVTITVTADASTAWAILVTTSAGVP